MSFEQLQAQKRAQHLPIRFYLASRFSRVEELRTYTAAILELGHEVTSRWTLYDHEYNEGTPKETIGLFGMEDLEDIQKADALVAFTDGRDQLWPGGGRHVEFGYALARNKVIVLIGPREHVFHYMPNVEVFPNWVTFVNKLLLW